MKQISHLTSFIIDRITFSHLDKAGVRFEAPLRVRSKLVFRFISVVLVGNLLSIPLTVKAAKASKPSTSTSSLLAATSKNGKVNSNDSSFQISRGTIHGGGGNTVGSDPNDILLFLNNSETIPTRFSRDIKKALISLTQMLRIDSFPRIQDAKASNSVRSILSLKGVSIENGLSPSLFQIKASIDNQCFHDGLESDASIQKIAGTEQFEICFNMMRLKRLPLHLAHRQIILLTLHELSHAAGYNEDDASYLQNYLERKFSTDSTFVTAPCTTLLVLKPMANTNVSNPPQMEHFLMHVTTDRFLLRNFWYYEKMYLTQNCENELCGGSSRSAQRDNLQTVSVDPKGNGKVKFQMYNADDSISDIEVEFSGLKKTDTGDFGTNQITKSHAILDGKSRAVERVWINSICLL